MSYLFVGMLCLNTAARAEMTVPAESVLQAGTPPQSAVNSRSSSEISLDEAAACNPYSCYTFGACSAGKLPGMFLSDDNCRTAGGDSFCDSTGICHGL